MREVNVKVTMVSIISWASLIFGCCALAFGGLQACLLWGGGQPSFQMDMTTLRGNLEFGVAISTVIGVGAIALGLWLRRTKGDSRPGPE